MSTIRAIPAVAIVMGLAACASDEQVVRSEPYCPEPTIVADLQQAESLASDGQIAWQARLGDLASICDVREFDYTVEMDVTVDLRTGPAFDGGPVRLAYFVAVATPLGDVIDKQTFPMVLEPGSNERRALRRETLRQRLPLTYRDERTTWSVLVGFEPTEQQIRERTETDPAGGESFPSSGVVAPVAPGSGQ